MTNEKITDIISEFCESDIRAVSAGIILDENAIEKTGGTAIYFTYPEVYAEDCRTITDEYEDVVYIKGEKGLSGNPKEVSMVLLKELLLYSVIVKNIGDMKELSDDEADAFIADIIEEFSESIDSVIQIYGKPRIGEIWTKAMMIKAIKETNETIEKAFESFRDLDEYQKLN